jgi:hypothetical protein
MANTIRLAPNLILPPEAVTQKFAVLGNPESGKSATATRMVEQISGLGVPVVVLDPKGDWWGIRSSKDGKKPGLSFVVFGGEHGDVPLEPTAGTLIADTIIDYQLSAILDLSLMSKTKQRAFATAFAERLYQRNRDPLMLVVDEADVLMPQRADATTARLVGSMEDIVKRGRGRGLGLVIASQRGQEVHKSVLDIIPNLILHNMTGRLTIKAINDWISVNAANDETSAAEVVGSLPTLKVGQVWFWSPAFMKTVRQCQIELFTTFDSKATPKPGQRRIVPVRRAEIDLAQLGEEIAATVERAKATDPTALRAKVAELTRTVADRDRDLAIALAELEQARSAEPVVVLAQIPAEVREQLRIAEKAAGEALDAVEAVRTASRIALLELDKAEQSPVPAGLPTRPVVPKRPEVSAGPTAGPAATPKPTPTPPPAGGAGPGVKLPRAQQAVLAALAPYAPRPRSKRQIGMLAGYSSKGGGFNNALSALRTAGHITGTGEAISITDEGLAALGEYTPLPTGEALQAHWLNQLGRAERLILEALIAAWPGSLTKEDVAERADYAPNGGGFNNALSRLRTLELITGRGELRAIDDLMEQ